MKDRDKIANDLDRITVKEGSIFEILDEIYMMIDVKDRSKFSKISLKFEEDLRNLFEEEKWIKK